MHLKDMLNKVRFKDKGITPSLDNVLDWYKKEIDTSNNDHLRLEIELKDDSELLFELVVKKLKDRNIDESNFALSSFHHDLLLKVKQTNPL